MGQDKQTVRLIGAYLPDLLKEVDLLHRLCRQLPYQIVRKLQVCSDRPKLRSTDCSYKRDD